MRKPLLVALFGLVLGLWATVPARAQAVAMSGSMGRQALLIINGGSPTLAAAGATVQGVKVLAVRADAVDIEDLKGRKLTVHLGASPVSLGGDGGGNDGQSKGQTIVMSAGSGGHYLSMGSINGKAVQFLVDTGASVISLGAADAQRLGLNYQGGQRVLNATANGVVSSYRVRLDQLQLQGVTLYGVDAIVTQADMPFVLLGNNFLSRFQMTQEQGELTLVRRY